MSIISHKHYKRININPILTSVIMNVLFTKRLYSYFSKEDKRLNNPSRSTKKALSPYKSPSQKTTSNLFLSDNLKLSILHSNDHQQIITILRLLLIKTNCKSDN